MVTTNSINNNNGRIFDPVSRWEVKGSFGCPFCFWFELMSSDAECLIGFYSLALSDSWIIYVVVQHGGFAA